MDAQIRIERLRSRYRLHGAHTAPWDVRQRLDRVVGDRVPRECAARLGELLPDSDPGVICIRRLDLKLVFGGGLPDDFKIATLWGRALSRAIARCLAEGSEGEQVVRFASWGEYLAQFAEDVARGTAWSKWYHESFMPLRSLPASGTIREALRHHPTAIAPALGLLRRRDRLRWVTSVLSETDAWAIFDSIEPAPGADTARVAIAVDAAADALGRQPLNVSPGRVALHLMGEVMRADADGPPEQPVIEALRQFAYLGPLVHGYPWQVPASGQTDFPHMAERLDSPARAALGYLHTHHPVALARLTRSEPTLSDESPPLSEAYWTTPYGGIFLLLPGLAELDLPALLAAAGLPASELDRLVPLGRWLILLKCLGPEHRAAVRYDPALALAAGLDTPVDAAALSDLVRLSLRLSKERLDTSLGEWAARRHLVSDQPPVAEEVRFRRQRARVERDGGNGLWLRGAVLSGRTSVQPPAAVGLSPLPGELAYLQTPELLRPVRTDLLWTHLSTVVLHLFARRLAGFSLSSAGHLGRNFLTGPSVVHYTDDGLVATLPRVPLQVVLRVGGWAGSRERVPWLPGETLLLEAGEE
jgi:hypothetical protein